MRTCMSLEKDTQQMLLLGSMHTFRINWKLINVFRCNLTIFYFSQFRTEVPLQYTPPPSKFRVEYQEKNFLN